MEPNPALLFTFLFLATAFSFIVSTVVHELGHYLTLAYYNQFEADVEYSLKLNYGDEFFSPHVDYKGYLNSKERFFIVLNGPLFNLFVALVSAVGFFFNITSLYLGLLFISLFCTNFIDGISNILPKIEKNKVRHAIDGAKLAIILYQNFNCVKKKFPFLEPLLDYYFKLCRYLSNSSIEDAIVEHARIQMILKLWNQQKKAKSKLK